MTNAVTNKLEEFTTLNLVARLNIVKYLFLFFLLLQRGKRAISVIKLDG
jgi:hypothetical protein